MLVGQSPAAHTREWEPSRMIWGLDGQIGAVHQPEQDGTAWAAHTYTYSDGHSLSDFPSFRHMRAHHPNHRPSDPIDYHGQEGTTADVDGIVQYTRESLSMNPSIPWDRVSLSTTPWITSDPASPSMNPSNSSDLSNPSNPSNPSPSPTSNPPPRHPNAHTSHPPSSSATPPPSPHAVSTPLHPPSPAQHHTSPNLWAHEQ